MDEVFSPEAVGEQRASELFETLLKRPELYLLFEELSTLYFSDELSTLISRNVSTSTFDFLLTKFRQQRALNDIISRYDAFSRGDYAS